MLPLLFKIPCKLLTDNGTEFISSEFKEQKLPNNRMCVFLNMMLPSLFMVPCKLLTDNGTEFMCSEFKEQKLTQ